MQRFRSLGRQAAIGGYAIAVSATGVDRRLLRRRARSGHLLVLNLHNVGPPIGPFTRRIPPRVFDQFVGWLKRECRLTTFRQLSASDDADERPLAILSFDDGYRDFVEYAMPILDRHGVRVNQNVVPACVDTGRPPWNVEILDLLGALPPARLASLGSFDASLPPVPTDGHGLMRWGVALSNLIKQHPRSEREPLVRDLLDRTGDGERAAVQPMMTAKDVAEVATIHEVGVHSYEHDSMEYESDEYFAQDVERCRAWFREKLGSDASIYAFPNGSYRESQLAIAQRAGIEHLLLVGERTASFTGNVHPRVTADGVTLRELRMRIARALRP